VEEEEVIKVLIIQWQAIATASMTVSKHSSSVAFLSRSQASIRLDTLKIDLRLFPTSHLNGGKSPRGRQHERGKRSSREK
jgi:hypothetical protein